MTDSTIHVNATGNKHTNQQVSEDTNTTVSKKIKTNSKSPLKIEHDKSSNNVSTTARQWLLLSLIERGKWVGTMYLKEQLKLGGFQVTIRTVQRDLVALSEKFLLEKSNTNPQGWRWRDDAPLQSMPNMNLSQAVAFNMVQANLAHMLPPAILTELFPWFDLASKQLEQSTAMKSWLDKVHIEPATQPLIPPYIDRSVKDDIYQAVFEQKQIVIDYTPRGQDLAKQYQLNPLAVVQRGAVIYLLATKIILIALDDLANDIHINENHINNSHANEDTVNAKDVNSKQDAKDDTLRYKDIRFFTLHRCQSVEILSSEAIIPKDFDLKDYIDTGAMGFYETRFDTLPNRGKETPVTLTFTSNSGGSLSESKLSDNQQLAYNKQGQIVITATINLTRQLVWWLRGFGKGLITAEPALLYEVVREHTEEN